MHWQVALTGLPLKASGCTAFTQHTGWTDSKALCWRPRTHPQTLYGAWPAQAHAARRGAPPDTPCTCPAATHRKECLIYILGTEESPQHSSLRSLQLAYCVSAASRWMLEANAAALRMTK